MVLVYASLNLLWWWPCFWCLDRVPEGAVGELFGLRLCLFEIIDSGLCIHLVEIRAFISLVFESEDLSLVFGCEGYTQPRKLIASVKIGDLLPLFSYVRYIRVFNEGCTT